MPCRATSSAEITGFESLEAAEVARETVAWEDGGEPAPAALVKMLSWVQKR